MSCIPPKTYQKRFVEYMKSKLAELKNESSG